MKNKANDTKKVVLNESMRKKLAGLLPMTSDSLFYFTPDVYDTLEIDEELKPSYGIRQLTESESKKIRELIGKTIQYSQQLNVNSKKEKALQQIRELNIEQQELTKKILMDWRNLYDISTGEQLSYDEKYKNCFTETALLSILKMGLKISGIDFMVS